MELSFTAAFCAHIADSGKKTERIGLEAQDDGQYQHRATIGTDARSVCSPWLHIRNTSHQLPEPLMQTASDDGWEMLDACFI